MTGDYTGLDWCGPRRLFHALTGWRLFGPIQAIVALFIAFGCGLHGPASILEVMGSQAKFQTPKVSESIEVSKFSVNIGDRISAVEGGQKRLIVGWNVQDATWNNCCARTDCRLSQFRCFVLRKRFKWIISGGCSHALPCLHVIGWRLPGIFKIQSSDKRPIVNNEIGLIQKNVSPQLACFGIAADGELALRVAEKEKGQNGITRDKQQRQSSNYAVPFAEIFGCFVISGILLFFGLPERNIQGFVMTLGGLLSFMMGLGLVLHLTENADVSSVSGASATCYRGIEDGRVLPIVVPELELRDVQRQIFAANFVVTADNPALNQRPEAFDCIGVDRANNMLPGFTSLWSSASIN